MEDKVLPTVGRADLMELDYAGVTALVGASAVLVALACVAPYVLGSYYVSLLSIALIAAIPRRPSGPNSA